MHHDPTATEKRKRKSMKTNVVPDSSNISKRWYGGFPVSFCCPPLNMLLSPNAEYVSFRLSKSDSSLSPCRVSAPSCNARRQRLNRLRSTRPCFHHLLSGGKPYTPLAPETQTMSSSRLSVRTAYILSVRLRGLQTRLWQLMMRMISSSAHLLLLPIPSRHRPPPSFEHRSGPL